MKMSRMAGSTEPTATSRANASRHAPVQSRIGKVAVNVAAGSAADEVRNRYLTPTRLPGSLPHAPLTVLIVTGRL